MRIPLVAWYCSQCGRSIPIEDERTFEADRRAHLERHQRLYTSRKQGNVHDLRRGCGTE
jgi:hypothetical protein